MFFILLFIGAFFSYYFFLKSVPLDSERSILGAEEKEKQRKKKDDGDFLKMLTVEPNKNALMVVEAPKLI